jgi:hypothetical protein
MSEAGMVDLEAMKEGPVCIHSGTQSDGIYLCHSCTARLWTNAIQLADEIERLREALSELLECADLRGDADLPHPSDGPLLWTARMQTAWDEARAALHTEPSEEERDAEG